jgi:RNA polymerase sigma-70 factor (ECF subfamily)
MGVPINQTSVTEDGVIEMSRNTSIEELYFRNVKTVYRLCFQYMKNVQDAEDATADTFCNILSKGKKFDSLEHEKAFLIRTAINICKNKLKHWTRKNVDIEVQTELRTDFEIDDTLKLVMELPEKYKSVIYLYYYEEYSTPEIAKILSKPESTVRNYLSEARKLLKEVIENEQ